MSIEAMKQEIVQAIRAAILRSKLNNIRTAPKDGQTVGDLAVRVESLELLCEGIEGEHYDQTALELCGECGWKAIIPGDGCLVCARQKAKPVAWVYPEFWDHLKQVNCGTAYRLNDDSMQPLYTAPREWVGLTDEEIKSFRNDWELRLDWNEIGYVRAIEAKLKAKNT